jgi:hypothetical protein
MPNGYAVVPNVLPGNVTIGGNLTVAGDQIRIGAAAPFTRVGKDAGGRMMFSVNLLNDLVSRDNAGLPAQGLFSDAAYAFLFRKNLNAAGTVFTPAQPEAWLADFSQHAHTGTVTEDTIYSKVLPGGMIGANGGLRVRVVMTDSSQLGVNTTVRFKLGGTTFLTVTFNVITAFLWDFYIANRGAANSQVIQGLQTILGTGVVSVINTTLAKDTTADQTFAVTAQNGTASDAQSFDEAHVELVNSYGPV